MSYNTSYTLEVYPERIESIRELRRVSEEAQYCLQPDGSSCEAGRWYEHEKDLKALSLKYSEHIFTLKGEGEDAGDLWIKYFRDGKMQVAKATITYEPFSARKLV